MGSKKEVLSTVKIQKAPDVYKMVDLLNRTLKDRDLLFGLALDEENEEKMVFTIYKT
ncbi:YpmA family protein [Alkalicoccobacillus gibsonii]|uniref:YpmA family protein n=1 Tax=Alkalicoccobacillus gibsonii TaxID=79881 RepID=A0ABU9VI11_9BACI